MTTGTVSTHLLQEGHAEPGSHPDEQDIAWYSLNGLDKQITQVQLLTVFSGTLLWQQTNA